MSVKENYRHANSSIRRANRDLPEWLKHPMEWRLTWTACIVAGKNGPWLRQVVGDPLPVGDGESVEIRHIRLYDRMPYVNGITRHRPLKGMP